LSATAASVMVAVSPNLNARCRARWRGRVRLAYSLYVYLDASGTACEPTPGFESENALLPHTQVSPANTAGESRLHDPSVAVDNETAPLDEQEQSTSLDCGSRGPGPLPGHAIDSICAWKAKDDTRPNRSSPVVSSTALPACLALTCRSTRLVAIGQIGDLAFAADDAP
jgi:hypothetical protein